MWGCGGNAMVWEWLTNQNCTCGEIKISLNSRTSWCHSVQNLPVALCGCETDPHNSREEGSVRALWADPLSVMCLLCLFSKYCFHFIQWKKCPMSFFFYSPFFLISYQLLLSSWGLAIPDWDILLWIMPYVSLNYNTNGTDCSQLYGCNSWKLQRRTHNISQGLWLILSPILHNHTIFDFWFWCMLKEKMYMNSAHSLGELQGKMRNEISTIRLCV
jgi:hypothetical protein